MGAPAYPSLALFKALLLQQWYGLSDPGLEEALADRLSFRRFIGLGLSEQVPDHSNLPWRAPTGWRRDILHAGRTPETMPKTRVRSVPHPRTRKLSERLE